MNRPDASWTRFRRKLHDEFIADDPATMEIDCSFCLLQRRRQRLMGHLDIDDFPVATTCVGDLDCHFFACEKFDFSEFHFTRFKHNISADVGRDRDPDLSKLRGNKLDRQ